jgi:hypothetical protein
MLLHENSKLNHVFVILRFDSDMAEEFGMKDDYIMVKKVVRSEEIACREVERLNQLNGAKGSVYFWRSARLDRDLRLEVEPELIDVESGREVRADHQA